MLYTYATAIACLCFRQTTVHYHTYGMWFPVAEGCVHELLYPCLLYFTYFTLHYGKLQLLFPASNTNTKAVMEASNITNNNRDE